MMDVQDRDALIIVDLQRDFLPGGALPVPRGDEIIPVLNRYIGQFRQAGRPVIVTRDWHPPDHCSFRDQGGPWPPHCVAGTAGAEFAPGLNLPAGAMVISKATDREKEAYSGFDNTPLEEQLRRQGVERLWIGGLATDYCVLATVRDALKRGFEVVLLTDAIEAVNVRPDDGERAVAEMIEAGAQPAA